jgi:hypothetical protein
VPGSGGKNGIVISLVDAIGLWPTFVVCLLALYFWMKVRLFVACVFGVCGRAVACRHGET